MLKFVYCTTNQTTMFSIFNRKKNVPGLEWLGVDIHSHLLPGIDDGAQNIGDSIILINGLKELGLRQFITTPHIFKEMYPNTPQTIQQAYNQLLSANPEQSNQLRFAAEYMIDDDFEEIVKEPLLCIQGNYVLIEMSYLYESPRLEEFIFDLQLKGYQPILAHPERYRFYHGKIQKLKNIKDRGILFQLNLLSLAGYYGKAEKTMSLELCNAGMIDLAATDIHHEKHLDALKACSAQGLFYKYLGEENLKNINLFSKEIV